MYIYVIRHGETDANKNAIIQGHYDAPLNDNGINLAKITGEKLKGIKFDACFSSRLARAKKTCELILEYSDNKGLDIKYDDRLLEVNLGDWEGKSAKLEDKEVPTLKLKCFLNNPLFASRPKNGETCIEVIKRTSSFLDEISKLNYENILVSSHGFAIRAMLNRFYKNRLDFWHKHIPPNCAVNIIEVNNGKMKLIEEDKIYYDKKLTKDFFNVG